MVAETDWREPILKHFTPEIAAVASVTIVVDPDGLLLEQRVLDRLRVAGFELMPFKDPVSFRLLYESTVRARRADTPAGATVVHTTSGSADVLPYDLLSEARVCRRVLQFAISDLFPKLAPSVPRLLDRADFDPLWSAYVLSPPDQLGERATIDYVLRHVFRLASEMIGDVPELLRALLELHYSRREIPPVLASQFVEQLQAQGRFTGWPLAEIVPHPDAFFSFLQDRWPRFLEWQAGSGEAVSEDAAKVSYMVGHQNLPFDHDSVRVYIDDLFVEGLLAPVEAPAAFPEDEAWFLVGVLGAEVRTPGKQVDVLTEQVRGRAPAPDVSYQDWLKYAPLWGEWLAAVVEQEGAPPSAVERYREDWLTVQNRFQEWMLRHFASLYSLPFLPHPPMVHHVAQFIRHASGEGKCALVVVDGMSFCQWAVIRESFMRSSPSVDLDEGATFAWIPTITPVSRQALFSGDFPLFFAGTIDKTNSDARRWQTFWEGEGLPKAGAPYLLQHKKEPTENFVARIREATADHRCKAVGVVVSTLDQAMHGVPLGLNGLQALVSADALHIPDVVKVLLNQHYVVWITSDHGNTQVAGAGKLVTGQLSEGGERVHLFSEEIHRSNAQRKCPDAIVWPAGAGLPDDFLPLIAPLDSGFTNPGTVAVTHGGLTVEEVIVPFVRVTRGD